MKNDGGPAYPQPLYNAEGYETDLIRGASLRDFFAAAALQGFIASFADPSHRRILNEKNQGAAEIANACFSIADAMLAERAK